MTSTSVDRIYGTSGSAAFKNPVKAATTANITLSGEQTIDGQALTDGMRCLVKNQTDTTENGIYYVSTGSWTRTPDFDGAKDVVTGTTVFVVSGTTNGAEYWYVSTSGDPDPGDAMAFTQAPIQDITVGTIATQNANNVAITGGSVTGITDITVADGGTGRSTLTSGAILVGNGTSGINHNSGVSLSTAGALAGYKSTIVTSTATAITLASSNHGGRTLVTTSTAAVTLTLPATLPVGFCAKIIQKGAGQVTCSASTAATLQNRQSHTKTAGTGAAIVLEVISQSTGVNAAYYNLAGDTGA